MNRPRVVIADDHPANAALLTELLQVEFDVVAHVPDGAALVDAVAALSPDVVVSDISMPGMDGIEAAQVILQRDPLARIVLVSVHGEPFLVSRGLAAGVMGYVLKVTAGDELLPAVRAALQGKRHLSVALSEPPPG